MNQKNEGLKCPPFSMMIKPIGSLCNLNCRYCYYHDKNELLHLDNYRISDKLLEQFIRQYLSVHPGPVVSFVWHGGEPSLCGIDFYRRVIELQKKHNIHNYQIWNNIQTNGTLLNDKWCDFLAKNGFDVGLSIDGTEEIHNYYRGQGTYEKVRETCGRLQRHGINPDLLCTVTSDTAGKPIETYQSLKSLNTGWMQFIPIVRFIDGKLTDDSVRAEDYGDFLIQIFDYWLKNDLASTGVQIFAETMMILMGQKPSLCTLAEICGQALVLEHDGNVYSCDHYVFDDYRLGNIMEHDLSELITSDKLREFALGKARLSKECRNCEVLRFCHGGCQKDRVRFPDDEIKRNILCPGLRMFFNHVEKPLSEIIALMRKGYSLKQIDQIMKGKK
ncbi:MAG: anaerobic sulfatase maturase [Erysipelotrichaceae bacterium]|nr:anaerobic sulfatase maturase [Erysipelotrichaceae bacterium]